MTLLLFACLAVAGGVGAALRLLVDGLIRTRIASFPLGTVVINVSGSFLLGLLVGLVTAGVLAPEVQLVAGTGFLGGYTTFSTASFETVRLIQERRGLAALLNAVGTVVLATAAAGLGILLGSLA